MWITLKKSMLLSAASLLLLFASACGANTDASNQTSSAPKSPDQAVSQQPDKEAPAPSNADAAPELVKLTVSAAASLSDSLKELEAIYEAGHPYVELAFNYGASGALQQQIEQGAPVDVFFSAAERNMKALVDDGLIDAGKQHNLLANELVVVVPAGNPQHIGSMADLAKAETKRVAIGIPDSVPAGRYAQEALTGAKLWDSLQEKLVQAKDVRQVLQYVETGNVEAGFVYRTDALASSKVEAAFTVDPTTHSPIVYPIGIVKASKHAAEAEAFTAFLQSDEARSVFTKYGFQYFGQ